MSTATTSTATIISAAEHGVLAAPRARPVKLYRNRKLGPAKREVFAAVTSAAQAGELDTKEAKHAFVQHWAQKHTRSAGVVRNWLREALAGMALLQKADPTPEDLQDQPAPKPIEPDLLSQVQAEPAPAPVAEQVAPLPMTPVLSPSVGASLLAVAWPIEAPPGEREAWWEVRQLQDFFGPAFDLSRCQVPAHARMQALLMLPELPASRFIVGELMRTDAVLLVLASNVVDLGAVHWFGELVKREYDDRFEAAAKRKRAETPTLTAPGGAQARLIMDPAGLRIDASAAFAAVFAGDERAYERFGIAPELRPSTLFMLLMPVLAEASADDRAGLGELVKWLATAALPLAASMDRAAGIVAA